MMMTILVHMFKFWCWRLLPFSLSYFFVNNAILKTKHHLTTLFLMHVSSSSSVWLWLNKESNQPNWTSYTATRWFRVFSSSLGRGLASFPEFLAHVQFFISKYFMHVLFSQSSLHFLFIEWFFIVNLLVWCC